MPIAALPFPNIDPVIVHLGPLAIHWYGVGYIVGILFAWWYGKRLVTNPRVLVLHEPTRGIDVGAKAEIYSILHGIAGEGMAIVMISSEIPELIMNAERVLVLRDGRLSGELTGQSINETAILARAMTS